MIRQHYLQQQRLNENHSRLLGRYQQLLAPTASQFRPFGTSQLPGRNYEQLFQSTGERKRYDGMSLATLSRNGIGTGNEAYQWTVRANNETLPNNVSSVVQHNRRHVPPLVQADRFEPVEVYEHPVFGPTPAYLRPVVGNERNDEADDVISLSDRQSELGDIEVSSQAPPVSPKPSRTDGDEGDDSTTPRGYISYKKWKSKYENLIPVDPLMFNIYANRPNGSIHRYGQSIYNSLNRNYEKRDTDRLSPTFSDSGSTISSKSNSTVSVASRRQYQQLKPKLFDKPDSLSLAGYVPPGDVKNFADDERRRPDIASLTISPPGPKLDTSNSTSNLASLLPTAGTSTAGNLFGINAATNGATTAPSINGNPALNSSVPPAPPLPPSLFSTSSAPTYQTPMSLVAAPANPIPPSTNNSIGVYQAPSSLAINGTGVGPRAVSFGASAALPTNADDVSSSSDSDDDSETRRKKRRKKRRAAGLPEDNDSSSSDD